MLIIDDHPATAEVMAQILKMKGFEAVIAYDGTSGLEKTNSEKPDLILLDIMMPEMNGFEVCEKLKLNPQTSKIPVIIVSIRASEDSIKEGKKMGADEYITKPFSPSKLIEVVERYLGKE